MLYDILWTLLYSFVVHYNYITGRHSTSINFTLHFRYFDITDTFTAKFLFSYIFILKKHVFSIICIFSFKISVKMHFLLSKCQMAHIKSGVNADKYCVFSDWGVNTALTLMPSVCCVFLFWQLYHTTQCTLSNSDIRWQDKFNGTFWRLFFCFLHINDKVYQGHFRKVPIGQINMP